MAETIKKGIWWLFLKIEEPRVIRLLQFLLYFVLGGVATVYIFNPPETYESILGEVLAEVMGGLIVLGAFLGGIACLPGIWWVERLGIIALATGLSVYMVVAASIQTSPLPLGLAFCLIVSLAIRWLQIRDFQFAPGR